MKKKDILNELENLTIIKGNNSMWVSENFYNPYFLMRSMFNKNEIEANTLTEKELNLIYDTAMYASYVFY